MLRSGLRTAARRLIEGATRATCRLLPPQVAIVARQQIEITLPMDYEPRPILLHVDTSTEFSTRLHSCAKEPETVAWLERSLRAGDVLFDVGANVGAYSLIAATHPGVRVYALEPAFANHAQLCRNVALNGCDDRVVTLPVALADRTALDVFHYHDAAAGAALHALRDSVDQAGRPFQPVMSQPVLSYRLDDLIEAFALPQPTHLKIDVDGIELAILRGTPRTLAAPALRSIMIELSHRDGSADTIVAIMTQHGFRLAERHELRDALGNPDTASNCIFVR